MHVAEWQKLHVPGFSGKLPSECRSALVGFADGCLVELSWRGARTSAVILRTICVVPIFHPAGLDLPGLECHAGRTILANAPVQWRAVMRPLPGPVVFLQLLLTLRVGQ